MTVKLETQQLGKRYRDALALAPTDLKVKSGEFLTLLGPSGSGKTTLLQLISGLVTPTQGRLFIDGVDATDKSAKERGIGLVFQSYALFPHLTVFENVAYPLRMRRTSKSEIARLVAEALAMVKMQEFGKRFPRELSGGQQQRVALARCFVYRPSVVLLDEPLGALDKNLREHMQLEMRRLHRQLNATFVYVTHDQEEALTMSDRICLMNKAKVEQLGTPLELYDRPATRFAASFLGHSNLLEGDVIDGAFHWNGISPTLPADASVAEGSAALLIRPEHGQLVDPTQGICKGRVSEVVFTGSDVRVLVDLESEFTFTIRTSRSVVPQPGDLVGISWSPENTVLLRT